MARSIQTLIPAFGGNRTGSEFVADKLAGCKWVGIPFAGGMSELLHLQAQSIVVNDLHCFVINLARCIQDEQAKRWECGRERPIESGKGCVAISLTTWHSVRQIAGTPQNCY